MIKELLASWNLGKEIPKIAVYAALGAALMLPFVCGKKTVVRNYSYNDTLISRFDSIIIERSVPSPPVVIHEVRTIIVDTSHDCWNYFYTVIDGDTVSIDSVNSCKGDYRGVRLAKAVDTDLLEGLEEIREGIAEGVPEMPPITSSKFGAQVDVFVGASLFHGTILGATARAWFDRWGLFVTPRLCAPDLKNSSIDGGISYRLF